MADCLYTFTGPVPEAFPPLRDAAGNKIIIPDAEREWLRRNPRQIARVRRVEIPSGNPAFPISTPVFLFSLRVSDRRQADGWLLATIDLPAMSPFCADDDDGESLDDVWPDMEGDPEQENHFVLSALAEAAYTGAGWAAAILRLLALPDTSGLDAEGWGADFTPYDPKAKPGYIID